MDRSLRFKKSLTKKTEHMEIHKSTFGNEVICDGCNADFTNSDRTGGMQFGSRAICPDCAPRWEANAKKYNEEDWIESRCPEGMTFRDYVVNILRGGKPGSITVIGF